MTSVSPAILPSEVPIGFELVVEGYGFNMLPVEFGLCSAPSYNEALALIDNTSNELYYLKPSERSDNRLVFIFQSLHRPNDFRPQFLSSPDLIPRSMILRLPIF